MPDRWMTYAEAGAEFGLSPEAVRKRVRRLHLATQLNNEDGRVRFLLPDGMTMYPAERPEDDSPDDRQDGRVDELRRQINGLEADLKEERASRIAAEVRAAVAEGALGRETEARQRVETALEAERESRRALEAQAVDDARQLTQFEADALAATAEREAARIERDTARREKAEAEEEAAQARAKAGAAEGAVAQARAEAEAVRKRLDAAMAAPWWRRVLGRF